jgi:hypothetical protein
MTQVPLNELTFSKKARKKIIEHLPTARKHRKSHIAGYGYVYFIYNELGERIGQAFKDFQKQSFVLNILPPQKIN